MSLQPSDSITIFGLKASYDTDKCLYIVYNREPFILFIRICLGNLIHSWSFLSRKKMGNGS